MSPFGLRARREALGLDVAEVAYAAQIRAQAVIDPTLDDALRIDAALTILETGGCLEIARAASVPAKPGAKPPHVFHVKRPPPWPEHSGGVERLSGQCFKDMVTTDGGGRLPMRPATPVVRNSALGD